MKRKGGGLLENICVLDLANDQGSFCSKLLAELGATVIKLEGAEEEPLRGIGPSNRAEPESLRPRMPFFYDNTNKLRIALELDSPKGKDVLVRLIESADVLVETMSPNQIEALDLGDRRLDGLNPHLIHISITGFGRTGPKRSYLSSDTIASAFGGQMYLSGTASGPPIKPIGRQSFYTASLYGANAVLLCLRRRKLTGKGCHIDLSVQESVASALDHVMIDYFHNMEIAGRHEENDLSRPFAVLPCIDGFVQIAALQNWDTLLQLMDSEDKAGDLLDTKWQRENHRKKHTKRITQTVAGWTQNHRRRELFELGQAMQFPWAPICTLRDVLKSPQLKARRFFIGGKVSLTDPMISIPGTPYRFSNTVLPSLKPAQLLDERARRILETLFSSRKKNRAEGGSRTHSRYSLKSGNILRGVRVLDLTRMLSGPYATRILGDFGAEVIKVQSALTAQGAERNDTPYFNAWNRNKRSVCLNLNHPEARKLFLDLTSISDIVVENYSPRVLINWCLTYKQLKRVKPGLIMASISAMGQSGPWKDYVGFAPTFHALSGMMSATNSVFDKPINLGHAYADVIAGLYAALAILASLDHRDRTDKGQYIDLSAYEATCTLLGPELMEADLAGKQNSPQRLLGDNNEAVPCGCFPCRGEDRWCAIVVADETQWQTFCRITGKPELMSARFSTAAKRRKNHSELEKLIAGWTRCCAVETIVRRLQGSGVGAAIVQNAEDLARDSQLAARHFFVSLDHPMLGKTYSDRSALWPWREKPDWKAAPKLGEDNRYVFTELLGCSDAQLRSLIEKGIVY